MDATKQPGIRVAQVLTLASEFRHVANALDLPTTTPISQSEVAVVQKTGLNKDETKGLAILEVQSGADGLYVFRLEIAALFEVDLEHPNMPLATFLKHNGPTFLFPFAREAVANLTMRGRFGPVWIQPTNVVIATMAVDEPQESPPAS